MDEPNSDVNQPRPTATGVWTITSYHPDGTVTERQTNFAEMVRFAATERPKSNAGPIRSVSD